MARSSRGSSEIDIFEEDCEMIDIAEFTMDEMIEIVELTIDEDINIVEWAMDEDIKIG